MHSSITVDAALLSMRLDFVGGLLFMQLHVSRGPFVWRMAPNGAKRKTKIEKKKAKCDRSAIDKCANAFSHKVHEIRCSLLMPPAAVQWGQQVSEGFPIWTVIRSE